MKKRRQKRRQKFIQLLGSKCGNCGSTKDLQFDHRVPKKKEFDLNLIKDGPESLILSELKKCKLLCMPCHMKKTRENKEFVNKDKVPSYHGSVHMYKKYKCRCKKCKMAMRNYYFSKIKNR